MTDRHIRQKTLAFIGDSGQSRLAHAHAVVVGLGAIGCVAADLLARAGVGTFTLIDGDTVDLTNLHRQSLFSERDARRGAAKVEAANERLLAIDATLRITPMAARITPENAESIVPTCDVIVDGTDNYESRYLLNDLAVKRGVALCYAGAVGAAGMAMTVRPGQTTCLRCVFPEPPPAEAQATCASEGVFAPAVYLAASTAASDALRLLAAERRENCGVGDVLTRFETSSGLARQTRLDRDPECPCCVRRAFEWLARRAGGVRVELVCGKDAVRVTPGMIAPDALARVAARCREKGTLLDASPYLVRTRAEVRGALVDATVFADGRAEVITRDEGVAREVYDRVVTPALSGG